MTTVEIVVVIVVFVVMIPRLILLCLRNDADKFFYQLRIILLTSIVALGCQKVFGAEDARTSIATIVLIGISTAMIIVNARDLIARRKDREGEPGDTEDPEVPS